MGQQKIRLSPARQKWADQFKPDTLRGGQLQPPLGVSAEFSGAIRKLTEQMIRETKSEIKAAFEDTWSDTMDGFTDVMDADVASQSQKILKRLQDKFTLLYNKAATVQVKRMVEKSMKAGATDLKTSLKEMAGNVTLKTDFLTDTLQTVVMASINEAVGLIKRVPEKFFGEIQGDVMRSITTGRGLQDLVPALDKRGVTVRNWAKNTALDQTRKVYNSVNAQRLQAVGVKKFQWIHSGGSNDPRHLHITKWPDGLNGGIFSFDDLPVIGTMYGEEVRGIPGQLPNCHCTMRPVFDFDDDA